MPVAEPQPLDDPERHLPRWLAALAAWQAKRPWLLVAIALATLLPALVAAAHLGLKLDLSELLPDSKESVIEMRRVSKRLAGSATLSIIVRTSSPGKQRELEACVDQLVPKLYGLGPEWVGAVDYGVKEARQFFDKNALFYASLEDVKKAHDRVLERYDWEVSKEQGSLLDDDEEPPPITASSIEQELSTRKKSSAGGDEPSYPNGYYENSEGSYAAVMLRTPVSGKAKIAELRRRVEAAVATVDPKRFEPSMTALYTGDVITGQDEYDRVTGDLVHVGALGIGGVLGIVFLYFLRLRIVMTMGGALLVGLAWTFGLTFFTIGYLNSSTGFLVSIIAGNGINYGIVYMARYVEARRDQSLDVTEAIRLAHRDTWIPTLASAATGALAYGSLIVTDFRGFKHFGIIGGYGMLFCWLSTYLFTPALLAASERIWPAYRSGQRADNVGRYFGLLFERIGLGAPRLVSALGAAIGIAAVALTVLYFHGDPMEYNMKKVSNDDASNPSAAKELSHLVDRVVGRVGQDGIAIVTDRVDQVQPLEAELARRRDAAGERKPFQKTVSIFSLLPSQQAEKLPLIEEMRDRILRAHTRGFIALEDWNKLEQHLPKGELHPITIADLPEQAARSFTERDGTRGRIVYIAPAEGRSVWDAKYLMEWANSFRHVTLPNGEVIHGSGRAVIFADMIYTIGQDAPRAIAVSALGTILVILVAFRGGRLALGVFVPWLVGIASLCAFMYLRDIKLNFLNFVAVPITIGIGAEYAHNMVQRYRFEGPGKLRHVVVATGGALTLCSLTTSIGYFALLSSINRGIHSFGLSAAVGELTCIAATVLWLPALLATLEKRREARSTGASA